MQYQVKITEKLQKIVTVNEDSAKEAIKHVKNAWGNGRIVLSGDDFAGEDFSIVGISTIDTKDIENVK